MKYKVIILLIIFSLIINLFSFKEGHDWGGDFAGYIKQSQTIADNSFDELNEHIKRTDFILYYPWGFPMLLTPVINNFEKDIKILKRYNYIFFILSMLFIYLYFKDNNKEFALICVLLISVNPYFWNFKNNILSEFASMLFTYISLFVIDLIYKKNFKIAYNIEQILLGIIIFLTFNMRTQNIALLSALAVYQLYLYKKDILKLANMIKLAIPYITFVCCYIIFKFINPVVSPSAYPLSVIYTFFETAQNNIGYLTTVFSELFKKLSFFTAFPEVMTGMFLLLFIIGLVSDIKSNILPLAFFVFSFVILLAWPFNQGLRFLISLVPIFFYYSIKGLSELIEKFNLLHHKKIFLSIIGIIVLASFKSIVMFSINLYKDETIVDGPYTKESIEMFNYIKENTATTDRIAFHKPRVMLLYTGRDAVFMLNKEDIKKANYFVSYNYGGNEVINSDSLVKLDYLLTFENESFKVFKIDK